MDKTLIQANNEFLSKQRLLVISPHSDDEAFGCAGTIARIKDLGGETYIMVVSIGDLKLYDGRKRLVKGSTRKEEFIKVTKFLKVDGFDIIYEDTQKHLRLDAIPRRELVAEMETKSKVAIDKIRPTMMAIPAPSYNQDHTAVFQAAFTATRPHIDEIKPFQNIVLAYDSPTLCWSGDKEAFRPNFYVDISDYVDIKLKALRMHKSQVKHKLHHCSVENLENLVRLRGREISVEAAEAFMCYRFVL